MEKVRRALSGEEEKVWRVGVGRQGKARQGSGGVEVMGKVSHY